MTDNVLNSFTMQGKRALITGGAGVLCKAIARGLAQAGAEVILADLRGEAADAAAKELTDEGFKASGVTMNVLDPAGIRKIADDIEAQGGLDILVLSEAGSWRHGWPGKQHLKVSVRQP